MAYIALARKYRPKTFDEVTGQSHITTTLKNALAKDRVAHAYLFAGPRGVGKTTTARILAKALNCEKAGKKYDPCNTCASCNEIAQGLSLDMIEIDGASNRGIDEIRNLRDSVKFAPSKGRFKIYIIDEVHMLTAEAFNALLKTLEEPPPHVKFIFATTQAHKVPSTILSRCQRFDFRRISAKDVFANLKSITEKEKLVVSDEALFLIAKSAEGSMRDGQIIMDQIASFTKEKISPEDVRSVLGLINEEALFGLSDAIAAKDTKAALRIIATLIDEGKDAFQLTLNLIEHYRNLLMAKTLKEPAFVMDMSGEKVERFVGGAKDLTAEDILYVIYTLSNTLDFIRRSSLSRVPLEAAIVKMTAIGTISSLENILNRIEKLEKGAIAVPLPSAAPKTHKIPAAPAVEAQAGKKPDVELDEILNCWKSVINKIMPKKISIASYLQEGYPVKMEGNILTVGFAKEFKFHKDVLEEQDNKRMIEEAVSATLNSDVRISLVITELEAGAKKTEDDDRDEEELLDPQQSVDPIVKEALEVFGGEITGRNSARPRKA